MRSLFTEHLDVSPWVMAALQPDRQNRSSDLAARAAAAAHYGKLYQHESAIDRATLLYTQGLADVQRDIRHPIHAMDTFTLANTMFLALYEMIIFRDITGWLTHFLGIGQLVRPCPKTSSDQCKKLNIPQIKFRGPRRHQTGVEKELFLTVRYFIVSLQYQQA